MARTWAQQFCEQCLEKHTPGTFGQGTILPDTGGRGLLEAYMRGREYLERTLHSILKVFPRGSEID